MVLLPAVLLGLIAGAIRAGVGKRTFIIPNLAGVWLVIVAFIPQWIIFFFPLGQGWASDEIAAAALVISQGLLLLFAWLNRTLIAFWVLGLGLILNLLVIGANGGLMPISPETLQHAEIDFPAEELQLGERVGGLKNVLLLAEQTRFEWLADRFVLPNELPFNFAYSAGDVFIAVGAFWLLWACGGPKAENLDLAART